MKELWQNWRAHRAQVLLEQDQLKYLNEADQEIIEYMVTYTLKINRRGTRAVVDDALTRIRAISGVTVVSSNTRQEHSTADTLTVDVEFKFTPVKNDFIAIKRQLRSIKKEMKLQPHVGSIVIKYNTFKRVR